VERAFCPHEGSTSLPTSFPRAVVITSEEGCRVDRLLSQFIPAFLDPLLGVLMRSWLLELSGKRYRVISRCPIFGSVAWKGVLPWSEEIVSVCRQSSSAVESGDQ
jgi:hypothetical protein